MKLIAPLRALSRLTITSRPPEWAKELKRVEVTSATIHRDAPPLREHVSTTDGSFKAELDPNVTGVSGFVKYSPYLSVLASGNRVVNKVFYVPIKDDSGIFKSNPSSGVDVSVKIERESNSK